MKDSIIGGIVVGLVMLLVGGLATWYFSDLRDNVEIGLRMNRLESDIGQVSARVDKLSDALNKTDTLYARLDERVNSLIPYNRKQLEAISNSKNIPTAKVNEAINFLDTNPGVEASTKYLKTDLGFSPAEVKAVVSPPQSKVLIEHPQAR